MFTNQKVKQGSYLGFMKISFKTMSLWLLPTLQFNLNI